MPGATNNPENNPTPPSSPSLSKRDQLLIEMVERRLERTADMGDAEINDIIASLDSLASTEMAQAEGSVHELRREARMWGQLRDAGAKTPNEGLDLIQGGKISRERILEWLDNGALHSGDRLIAVAIGYDSDDEIQEKTLAIIKTLRQQPLSEDGQVKD